MIDSISTVEDVSAPGATNTADATAAALEVRNLTTEFTTRQGPLPAVAGVSFSVANGRVLAVIGESGSGKSAMLRSIIGIQPKTATVGGDVFLAGRNLTTLLHAPVNESVVATFQWCSRIRSLRWTRCTRSKAT